MNKEVGTIEMWKNPEVKGNVGICSIKSTFWWLFLIAQNEFHCVGFVLVGGRGEGAMSTWPPLPTIRQPFHLHRLYNILPNHSAFFSSALTISKLLRNCLPRWLFRTSFHTIGIQRVIQTASVIQSACWRWFVLQFKLLT